MGRARLKCTYDKMHYFYYYCYYYYYYYSTKIPGTRYVVPGTYIFRGVSAVAPDADHPTRTLTPTLTRTLWGDLSLDAVACEGSRGMLWMRGFTGMHQPFQNSTPGLGGKLLRIRVECLQKGTDCSP